MGRQFNRDDYGYSEPQAPHRSRRPSGNGAPAWLKAMLVEQWADAVCPTIVTSKEEKCAKCDNRETQHKLRRICSGVLHTCLSCGKTSIRE
jgi:hypothetical protein